jgi:hypothetical protein
MYQNFFYTYTMRNYGRHGLIAAALATSFLETAIVIFYLMVTEYVKSMMVAF